MGGPASCTSPTTTSSAPNPKNSMLVSRTDLAGGGAAVQRTEKPPAGGYHVRIVAGLGLVGERTVTAVVVSSCVAS
jgi:hypothetical protein